MGHSPLIELDAFLRYVRSMPQSEAQTALIALAQCFAHLQDPRFEYVRVCRQCGALAGVSHQCGLLPDATEAQHALMEHVGEGE